MKCPYCGSPDDQVLESRPAKEGYAIRRRRQCVGCGRRYTTYEEIEEMQPQVVKRDGRREPFDRQKVMRGLMLACQKRSVPMEAIDQIVNDVENEFYGSGRKETSTVEIGEYLMKRLLELDSVAYVRFASVYQEFQDATEFRSLVDRIAAGGRSR